MQNRFTDSSQSGSIIKLSYRQQHDAIYVLFRAELWVSVFVTWLPVRCQAAQQEAALPTQVSNFEFVWANQKHLISISSQGADHISEEPISPRLATLQHAKLLEPASLTRDEKPCGEQWFINTTAGTRLERDTTALTNSYIKLMKKRR